ncbi:MAG: DUF3025 domain-containing protein [Lysobacter sp.]|nr:DUF3025 domain-containing protein [Lysobacter sp.]
MKSLTQPQSIEAGAVSRRFVAPQRGQVAADCFDHPVFSACAGQRGWLQCETWPTIEAMNAALHAASDGAADLQFVQQSQALLDEGLHYEQRIHHDGRIATRLHNWHDLFNALIWIRYPALKRALNHRQVEEIDRVGLKVRSRAQSALTHFDEGGAVIVVRDPTLLALWDAHDWPGLFWRHRSAWMDGRIEIAAVFGHALLEHALQPQQLLVAKCIAVATMADAKQAIASVGEAVIAGALLNDPQELRPLPLSGVPGWHPQSSEQDFYRHAACFKPLREGRIYPAPLQVGCLGNLSHGTPSGRRSAPGRDGPYW